MKLEPLTLEQVEKVRQWRLQNPESLRTTISLTSKMQEDFYYEIICDRRSNHKFWAITSEYSFVGMGGITNIEWENRIGEISLIIGLNFRKRGYGTIAVDLLLNHAFNQMNLYTIYGEVFECNEAGLAFWRQIVEKYNGYMTVLADRKYWNGEYWDSFYFSINKEKFNEKT